MDQIRTAIHSLINTIKANAGLLIVLGLALLSLAGMFSWQYVYTAQKLNDGAMGRSWVETFIPIYVIGGIILFLLMAGSLIYFLLDSRCIRGCCVAFTLVPIVFGIVTVLLYVPLVYLALYLDGDVSNPMKFIWIYYLAGACFCVRFFTICAGPKQNKNENETSESLGDYMKRTLVLPAMGICYILTAFRLNKKLTENDYDENYVYVFLPIIIAHYLELLVSIIINAITLIFIVDTVKTYKKSLPYIVIGIILLKGGQAVFYNMLAMFLDGTNFTSSPGWIIMMPALVPVALCGIVGIILMFLATCVKYCASSDIESEI